jgi:2-methylaconitate cis-trans-isomerase PrpF
MTCLRLARLYITRDKSQTGVHLDLRKTEAIPTASLITIMMNRLLRTSIVRRYSTLNIPNPLPATFLRGGTSKGIFIKRSDLPDDRSQWDPIFLGMMGSPDKEYGRQLDGMGGGVSSLSKICVVGPPSVPHASSIHAEYTFAQVGIHDGTVDYSGNCGNLSSMIGIFALDEDICAYPQLESSTATIRLFNTNTSKYINTTFPVSVVDGRPIPLLDLEQASIAGVPGKASKIVLNFVSPGGARTGKLLPTGSATDSIQVANANKEHQLRLSLVDATNPTVFILSSELRNSLSVPYSSSIDFTSQVTLEFLERIRQQGAQLMCLDPLAQAQPKLAIISPPSSSDPDVDVFVHTLSMGVLHRAVPMTVGLCLGVAAGIKDSLAWEIVKTSKELRGYSENDTIKIKHPSGIVEVGSEFDESRNVNMAKVVRTGRRLMKGVVWW